MKIGITGSRNGLDPESEWEFKQTILELASDSEAEEVTILHGDCTGVDAYAHQIAEWYGFKTHIYPPENDTYRAWCVGDMTFPEKPYLDRNRDIVDDCDVLVAAPVGESRGTRYTINYASKQGVQTFIIPEP